MSYGETSCGTLNNQLQTDKTYTLSFWAKGSGTIDIGFDIDADSTPDADTSSSTTDAIFESDLTLTTTWQEFQVGPLNMTSADYSTFGDGTVLVFSPDSGATLYLDNVVLREGEQEITLIKDSWVTPATCDMDINGNISDQYYLGCSEYLQTDGTTVNLRSFSKLCDEDMVGCTGYFQTENSDSEFAAMYNAVCENTDIDGDGADRTTASTDCYLFTATDGTFDTTSPELCMIKSGETSCQFDADYLISQVMIDSDKRLSHLYLAGDTIIIPADHDIFAIVGSEDECDSASASCTEVGQVIFTEDRSAVDSYESIFLMNDPDSYDDILCDRDEQYCQAFDGGSAGTYYFKDPVGQTCEYKTSVVVGSSTYDGWFRTGTNEFCYGTGSCSNNSATSCSTDSDCRIGVCSNDSSDCYSGFDCDTGAYCSVSDEDATCVLENGSYLVGGDYSGVWANGDLAFDNWTATCSAEFNGCSEFQDLLDIADDEFYGVTDGESYFFLNNDNLDENTLVTSQQCSGQVSNSLGCVLFNDTGLPGLDYNASATYIASVHANELFGDSSFDLVDPIDCDGGNSTITEPDGDTVDLCAQRCAYDRGDLYVSDLGGDAGGKRMEERRSNDPYIYEMDDIYVFGTSCYEDTDCPDMIGDTGDAVSGTCETEVQTSPDETVYYDSDDDGVQDTLLTIDINEDVPALENDTNRILKVNRDRQCSEWLTCASSQTVWDESTGKYKTICDGIDLCTEYSALGDSSFCSAWNPDDPTVILDSERYADRDVSWYGSEYSGYAVPGGFPVQRLSQVNIAAYGTCSTSGDACDIDDDCDSSETCETANEQDYRLAYDAGECTDGYNNECTVGYCANTASPCSASTDCEPSGGECIVGACYNISETVCTDDSQCTGDGETCMSGLCTADVGDCGLDFTCSSGTCFQSVAVKTGSCYRDRCIVAPNGDKFDEETAESQVCRAWPEISSPFPNDVVSEWSKPTFNSAGDFTELVHQSALPTAIATDSSTVMDLRFLPFSRLPGFDQARTCLPGEDCDCNYTKLSNSLGKVAYIDEATSTDDIEDSLNSINGSRGSTNKLGICSSSESDGSLCVNDEDCGDIATGAKCNPITKEDEAIGLQGYCLERDTGISILGQADLGACLTWFPVDQLTGSTDLSAKYKKAGYFEDTYACNSVTGFIDLENSTVGCAEIGDHTCQQTSPDDSIDWCIASVDCPDDYFAIMGQCLSDDNWAGANPGSGGDSEGGGTNAYDCSEGIHSPGANGDCPFMCIPIGSKREDGTVCSVPDAVDRRGTSPDNTNVYVITGVDSGASGDADAEDWPETEDFEEFDISVADYSTCTLEGVEVTEDIYDENFTTKCLSGSDSEGNDVVGEACYFQEFTHNVYVGCEEVTQVATSDESYAWTDRLLGNNKTSFTVDGSVDGVSYPKMNYVYGTLQGPYGLNLRQQPEDRPDDYPPLRIGQCYNASGSSFIFKGPEESDDDGLFDECASGYTPGSPDGVSGMDPTDVENLDSRSFINFSLQSGKFEMTPATDGYTAVWNRINQIFALPTVGKFYEWAGDGLGTANGETLDYVLNGDLADALYPDYKYSTDARDEGNPPTIWPLDVDNCFGQYCREGDANTGITVNDSNEGVQTGSGGFFRGTVKFYAAADKNQLPLRRVIVDWGDAGTPSGSSDTDNFYKNHRGILPDSQTQTYCDACDTTTDVSCEWGMTADSCDPNYFSYQHNYRCSDSDLVTMDSCVLDASGIITNSPCSDGDACYYRPSVHVRDNWGWCSGTCTVIGDEGCFEGSSDSLADPSNPNGECSYLIYPDDDPTIDPWVYYDGQIVVTP